MAMGNGEYLLRARFLDHSNLPMVMDHARMDPDLMGRLISRSEERSALDRAIEESSLLDWARSAQRAQGMR